MLVEMRYFLRAFGAPSSATGLLGTKVFWQRAEQCWLLGVLEQSKGSLSNRSKANVAGGSAMDSIIYLVGLVVIVMLILSALGLR